MQGFLRTRVTLSDAISGSLTKASVSLNNPIVGTHVPDKY